MALATGIYPACLNHIWHIKANNSLVVDQPMVIRPSVDGLYRPCAHDVTGDYVIDLRHFEWQDGKELLCRRVYIPTVTKRAPD